MSNKDRRLHYTVFISIFVLVTVVAVSSYTGALVLSNSESLFLIVPLGFIFCGIVTALYFLFRSPIDKYGSSLSFHLSRIGPRGKQYVSHSDTPKTLSEKIDTIIKAYEAHIEKLQKEITKMEIVSKNKTDFLVNMSHSIRTPLNGIIGFSEMIRHGSTVEDCQKYANTILFESEHILSIINDILDKDKIENGTIILEEQPVNLKLLIKSVVECFKAEENSVGAPNVTCDFSLDFYPYIIGDSVRIRQVMINLINHAIKFSMTDNIYVYINSLKDDSEKVYTYQFYISDKRIISHLELHKNFQNFEEFDQRMLWERGAYGLGTTLAAELINVMGGKIIIDTDSKQGNTYSFSLIFKVAEADSFYDTANEDLILSSKNSGTILIAEDYLVNQKIIRHHLESVGYSLTIFDNGEDAFNDALAKKYDLIILDLQMPRMMGNEVAEKLRQTTNINKNTPIIGLTANADTESKQLCIDAGMNFILTKPIRKSTLCVAVEKWLTQPNEIFVEKNVDVHVSNQKISKKPIDYSAALKEFGNMELIKEMVSQFIMCVDNQINTMKLAVSKNDLTTVAKESHAVKGGASTLEARQLANVAHILEKICKDKLAQADEESLSDKEVQNALHNLIREFEKLKLFALE